MIELDPSTLDELTALISGDGDRPVYRSAAKLRIFLERAGISPIPDFSGLPRRDAVRQALGGVTGDMTNAERAVLRLADRREFPSSNNAYEDTQRELTEILGREKLRVIHDGHARPRVIAVGKDEGRPREVRLKVKLSQVIDNPGLVAINQERLDEANTCQRAKAYMSTIIMLGSLLEGVLLAAVSERSHGQLPKPIDRMGLQDLMDFAHKEGWIQFDAHKGSELVREYRNLVHPHLQVRRIGHPPDEDTSAMCWPVVNATLNDLAATRRPSRPSPSGPARLDRAHGRDCELTDYCLRLRLGSVGRPDRRLDRR